MRVDPPRENAVRNEAKQDRYVPEHPVIMKPEELRASLGQLECNAPALGKVIKAHERTARRWVSGELQVPPAVSVLVRICVLVARNAPYDEFHKSLLDQAALIADWQTQRRAARKEAKRAAKTA